MKSVFLFSTRLRVFLIELPPILLLIPSIFFNRHVDTLMKLYPLIISMSLLIIFIAIYFFRGMIINNEEVRCIGLFSSKEQAAIKKGRHLLITIIKKGRLRIELYGENTDGDSNYAWLKNEKPSEINLFRCKVNGRLGTVHRILRYFEAESDTADSLLNKDSYTEELENVIVSSYIREEGKTFKIFFKETI